MSTLYPAWSEPNWKASRIRDYIRSIYVSQCENPSISVRNDVDYLKRTLGGEYRLEEYGNVWVTCRFGSRSVILHLHEGATVEETYAAFERTGLVRRLSRVEILLKTEYGEVLCRSTHGTFTLREMGFGPHVLLDVKRLVNEPLHLGLHAMVTLNVPANSFTEPVRELVVEVDYSAGLARFNQALDYKYDHFENSSAHKEYEQKKARQCMNKVLNSLHMDVRTIEPVLVRRQDGQIDKWPKSVLMTTMLVLHTYGVTSLDVSRMIYDRLAMNPFDYEKKASQWIPLRREVEAFFDGDNPHSFRIKWTRRRSAGQEDTTVPLIFNAPHMHVRIFLPHEPEDHFDADFPIVDRYAEYTDKEIELDSGDTKFDSRKMFRHGFHLYTVPSASPSDNMVRIRCNHDIATLQS